MASPEKFWQSCLAYFQQELPQQQYRAWIQPLSFSFDSDNGTVLVPNRLALRWIRERFLDTIGTMAKESLGPQVVIRAIQIGRAHV